MTPLANRYITVRVWVNIGNSLIESLEKSGLCGYSNYTLEWTSTHASLLDEHHLLKASDALDGRLSTFGKRTSALVTAAKSAPIPQVAYVASVLYIGATAADLTSTTVALHLGLQEGNPIVSPTIGAFGLLPQVAVSAFLCYVLCWYARRGGAKLVVVLAALRWFVVANNIFQLGSTNHLWAALAH